MDLGQHKLINADCLEYMRALPGDCIDSVICDPPYGLGFMGQQWDQSVPGLEWAQELLRVAKPGAHAICFGGTRTYHRLAVALEDAGWEIRDCLGWVYTSGFPKSHNVSKAIDREAGAVREVVGINESVNVYAGRHAFGPSMAGQAYTKSPITAPATEAAQKFDGWGTALKPSFEPAVLARKPLEGTIAQNVLRWGTGALNIDAARFGYGDPCWVGPQGVNLNGGGYSPDSGSRGAGFTINRGLSGFVDPGGRWPANLYHCPKASRSEREAGCEGLPIKDANKWNSGGIGERRREAGQSQRGNHHPTVKPLTLFRWLARLCTPIDGWIFDPFLGSGTTMLAAELEGFRCVGVEMNPEYIKIIQARFSGIPILRKMASGQTLTSADKQDLISQGELF